MLLEFGAPERMDEVIGHVDSCEGTAD